MASFDIVSEVNLQEVENAINQARREVDGRYDLRGGNCQIDWDKKEIALNADDDYKVKAMRDILQSKLHKRGVEISAVKFATVEPVGGKMLKQKAEIVQGIEKEKAKEIVKSIKDSKLKVQAQIMDEQIRVTSKSIDELQATIQHCGQQKFGIPLQFTNMRS